MDLPSRGTRVRDRLILIAFCSILWLPALGTRTLWHPDEPRFALMTRSMLERGEYVAPTKMGEVYHSKPPLYHWMAVLSSRLLGGVTEVSMRLPSFLAGLGGVLVVHALGAMLFGDRIALMSGLILATSNRYLHSAQWASTDMSLCFFVTASLASFSLGYRSGDRRWYLLMYVACGLATLTKGPVGFVLPGLVVLCFLALRRDLREVTRLRLPLGILIGAAIVLPWLLLYSRRAGGEHVSNLLLVQTFTRYLSAWNNEHAWFYYLWRLPVDMLPWSLLLPPALWYTATRMEKGYRLFLLAWFTMVLLFYSGATGKRGVYILPLYAPAAIMIAWFWDRACSADWAPDGLRKLTRSALGGIIVALGVVWATMGYRLGAMNAVWGGVAVASGIGIIAAPCRRTIIAVCLTMALVVSGAVITFVPIVNDREALMEFTHAIKDHVPPGASLGITTHSEEIAFYAEHSPDLEIRPGERVEEWLETSGNRYAILDQACYDDLTARQDGSWEVLARGHLARGRYYLVAKGDMEDPR